MTVKQLLGVIDKKTMVEVRGEHDCEESGLAQDITL